MNPSEFFGVTHRIEMRGRQSELERERKEFIDASLIEGIRNRRKLEEIELPLPDYSMILTSFYTTSLLPVNVQVAVSITPSGRILTTKHTPEKVVKVDR